ncbi:MAG: FAD binding domain-containing protein [bacterium]|nr:FAD binding domain-containing protein [bacterium]
MGSTAEVVQPGSPSDAASAFGDGAGVAVLAGGTLLVPDLHFGRSRPERVIMLGEAGLDYVSNSNGTVTIGATTPVVALVGEAAPLGPCAASIGDNEIRAQATVGGNLCAPAGFGDLQGPLLALGATARSAGAGGERSESLEDFLADREGRLLLDVTYSEPAAGSFAGLGRPHAHHYTVMAVSGVRTSGGAVQLAVVGAGGVGARLRGAEALATDPEAAGRAAAGEVAPSDDPLASGWYRARTLPALVTQVLNDLEESA